MRMEKSIEQAFTQAIVRWGLKEGIGLECIKFSVPGRMGFPDRWIMWGPPFGCMFIEFKQPGEKPRPLQNHVHQIMRAKGAEVQVHDDVNIALDAAKRYIRSTLRADTGHEANRSQQGGPAIPASGEGQNGYGPQKFCGSKEVGNGGCIAGTGAPTGGDD